MSRKLANVRKIYVASSWKNVAQPAIVLALRRIGYEVYDFRHPAPGDNGFHWSECLPGYQRGQNVTPEQYKTMLKTPRAQEGYEHDIDALRRCDAVVYVLPCGRSASWEFGYAVGAGKMSFVIMFEPDQPDLMFMESDIITSMEELFDTFGEPEVS
jgi:nucleoside 2-deoxyribosyltransferase